MIHCYDGPLAGQIIPPLPDLRGYIVAAYRMAPHDPVREAEYFIWPGAGVALYVGRAS